MLRKARLEISELYFELIDICALSAKRNNLHKRTKRDIKLVELALKQNLAPPPVPSG